MQRLLDFDARDQARRAGRADGRRRRDSAHLGLMLRRELYVRAAQRALLLYLLAHETAMVDDVRAAVALPNDIDPTLIGAAMRALAVGGLIRGDGYAQTARPVAHARPVTVWRLVDADAARQWLVDHPEMPAPSVATPVCEVTP